MDTKISQTVNYHTNQLTKNFGLQETVKEDVRGELTLKALTIIEAITEDMEDFEEGEASMVTYVKRCLDNKASDIARDFQGFPPKVNNDNALIALDIEERYKNSANRNEDYTPLTVSMDGQLQHLSVCDHEHDLELKMDIEETMSALTPRQKDIVEMLEEGKTQEQIAEMLNVSERHIRNLISEIREKFRKLLN